MSFSPFNTTACDTFFRRRAVAVLLLLLSYSVAAAGGQRIVGGELAAEGQFPWMVALVNARVDDAYAGQFCGGSLIAPQWVLTAAHCVTSRVDFQPNPAESLDVVIGRANLSDAGGERLGVARVIVHPQYASTRYPDIALLQLQAPSEYPVIEMAGVGTTLEATSTPAVVAGWGRLGETLSAPSELQYVGVPIVDFDYCKSRFGSDLPFQHIICAGWDEGGRDACGGDSGGPLFAEAQSGIRVRQVGIVSFGVGCARAGWPGAYARVSANRDWIDQSIADNSGGSGSGGGSGSSSGGSSGSSSGSSGSPATQLRARFRISCNDLVCRLDASTSTAADVPITQYVWGLSDGIKLSGLNPEHVFSKPGIYNVVLVVVDENRRKNSWRRKIAVSATPGGARTIENFRGRTRVTSVRHILPSASGLWSNRGVIRGDLRSLRQSDHLLILQKQRLATGQWYEIARADHIGDREVVNFRVSAGVYRWVVKNGSEPGSYRFRSWRP